MRRVSDSLLALQASLDDLPLFPLPEMVFFPGVGLPLHVFEPRYRVMVKDCMAKGGALAIVLLLPGADEAGFPRIARVAGGGVIVEHEALPDGRSNVLVQGLARLELEELPFIPQYRRAKARILREPHSPVDEGDRAALVSAATSFARAIRERDASFDLRLPQELDTAHLADVCAFQLLTSAESRQRVLETLDPGRRVRMVIEQLMLQKSSLGRASSPHSLN